MKVAQAALPWTERASPRGTFRRFRRDLSGALADPTAGRAPFEVELVRLPPGAANCPYHSHSAEWECYLVLAGSGALRTERGREPLAAGDCVLCPPGEAHQLVNDGADDLRYYVIADNAAGDVWHYPDSAKWGFTVPGGDDRYFRTVAADYFDGEE